MTIASSPHLKIELECFSSAVSTACTVLDRVAAATGVPDSESRNLGAMALRVLWEESVHSSTDRMEHRIPEVVTPAPLQYYEFF
jgi:hypothetical protein